MRRFCFVFFVFVLLTFFSCEAFSDEIPITEVMLAPYRDSVSMSTVELDLGSGFVTCPTVELRGRRAVNIYNPSSTDYVFLSGVSPSSVSRWLNPRQSVTFRASSDNHIFASSDTVIKLQVVEIR